MEVQQLYKIANELRNELVQQVERNGTTFKGHLKNSITVGFKNNKLIIKTIGYGRDIEYGKTPGTRVTPDELREWCKIKLGDESLAGAVAQKIYEEGTDPQPFIRPVIFNKLKGIIQKHVTQ
jgi:hypothetical protein